MYKKLFIFDADGTMLDSPMPEQGKLEYERIMGKPFPFPGWWGRPESLLPEYDIKPLPDVLAHYHRACDDDFAARVLLTNRLYRLKPQIIPILEKNNLYFHHNSFKYNGKSKVDRALQIIDEEFPDVTEVEFFDDMIEHVMSFTEMWTKRPDIKLTIHLVSKDKEWIKLEEPSHISKL